MKVKSIAWLPFLLLLVLFSKAEEGSESEVDGSEIAEEGEGRVFPLIPIFPFLLPYINVDLIENWNKLNTERNALYFLVRDTITLTGVNLMWIVLHSIFWDGNAANTEDVVDSLLTPGVKISLKGNTTDTSRDGSIRRLDQAQDRVSLDSVDTLVESFSNLSFQKFWNFFANTDTSTRNLFLNLGFASFSHLMFIIPTYFGMIPVPPIENVHPVIEDVPRNEPLRLWNRLFCPQCVLHIVGVNTLVWIGKTLWWSFMSSIPDVVGQEGDGSFARMFADEQEDGGILFNIAKTFLSNASELIFSRELAESLGL